MTPLHAVKAILWDNDGVLVDTERLYRDATRQVLAGAGVILSDGEYRDLHLKRNDGAWHLVAQRGYGVADIARLRAQRGELYSAALRVGNHAIAGVASVLQALHGRYAMGVVTTSRRQHFDIIHASSGLLRYFDFVLTREDYANSKPDPEPYLAAIAKTGCGAGQCLAVEDTPRGLAAAVSAGLKCVVIRSALTDGADFSAAYRVVDDVREVPALLGVACPSAPV